MVCWTSRRSSPSSPLALLYLLSAGHVRFREFLAGVVLGLLALTRENALLLALPVLAWFVLGGRRAASADSPTTQRRTWVGGLAFLAGCALVLLPVGVRNYAVGGEFLLTTSQFGPNFYIGNHAGATGLYESLVPGHGSAADERADAVRMAEEASGRTLSPSEVSSFWTARALDFIRTEPGAWLRLLARKLALTFNAVEIADTESQEVYAEWSSLLRVLAFFSFGVVLCGAAFGACLTIKRLAAVVVAVCDRVHLHAEHHHLFRVCEVSLPACTGAAAVGGRRVGRVARRFGTADAPLGLRRGGSCRGRGVSAARGHPRRSHRALRQYRQYTCSSIPERGIRRRSFTTRR